MSATSNTALESVDTGSLRASYAISTPVGGPAALFLATALAFQTAHVTHGGLYVGHATSIVAAAAHSASQQVTAAASMNLADDLLRFHRQLVGRQRDLPEDAARVLRENIWALYE